MKSNGLAVGLQPGSRHRVAEGLGVLLADTHTLYLTTHGYHWNVTGPMFPSLHILFEQQYNELWLAMDLIAERLRGLDQPAPFGCRTYARQTGLADGKATDATTMLRDLVAGHEAVAQSLRRLSAEAERAGDEVTLDLLTGRLAAHDKARWMLRATATGPAAKGRRASRPARA